MINLLELVNKYGKKGYSGDDAAAKVCQDIILLLISNSKYSRNITIKGGVVMHSISNDIRRATRDLDIDFIKYSLDDSSIIRFIENLCDSRIGINIKVVGKIEPLHHQDYDGKRVFVKLVDNFNNELESKLDIGVHKQFELTQDDYCFNLEIINESANLLINSPEQIFAEKLKSLLKIGSSSTRYKDIFDFYYLISSNKINKTKLKKCLKLLIYNDSSMKENKIDDIISRLDSIYNSNFYKSNLKKITNNWLEISPFDAISFILNYLNNL